MPLIESAAARILSTHANRNARAHQAGESQRFSHAVVDIALTSAHLCALLK
jgi:hypothetical protein